MRRAGGACALIAMAVIVAACSSATPAGSSNRALQSPAADRAPTALSVVVKKEPVTIALAGAGGVSQDEVKAALFTAGLARTDDNEAPYLVLAEKLPALHSDSWQVFSDGRMQTTYTLRPGLEWHDGQPLVAGDFAFATRVNSALYESGQTNPTTEARQIEDVLTPDPRTLVIRWSSLYIGAETPALEPFPEHILAEPLAAGDLQAFASLPYWTTAYVGAGPYRLDRWEPGAFIDGTAFDRYALGTPKITRVRITWSADPNVALAGLLSDQYQMAADTAIEFEQVATIEDRWGPAGGRVILNPTQVRYQMVQARPEFVDPPTLLDVRVRRALYQAIDRRALATAMLGDEAIVADSLVPPKTSFFKDLDAAIQKYPYDPRATEQLMAEAGFSKDQEGMFVGPAGARFAPALWGIAQGQEAQETTAVADFYRRAGVDVRLNLIPQARYTQDRNVVLNQFPALRDTYCTLLLDRCMDKFASSLIASADTRWQGQNRIGWANAEFDAYYDQYWKSLEPAERDRTVVEMARILSKELPSLPFYFNVSVVAHSARLHGPKPVAPLTTAYWDIHEWTMGERYGRNVTSPLAERWIQADS